MTDVEDRYSRDTLSDLHDLADEVGEGIATDKSPFDQEVDRRVERIKALVADAKDGVKVDYQKVVARDPSTCTCRRYSKRSEDGYLNFWYEADPDCEYAHLQPLPMPHRVKLL